MLQHRVKFIWSALLLLLSLQLTACSFQLRGSEGVFANPQLQSIALRTDATTDGAIKESIADLLPKSIDLQTVQVIVSLPTANEADMRQELFLVLEGTKKQQKRTAVSAIGETTAEFIRWVQPYQVLNIKGERLLSDEAFAYRDRQLDPQGLMAANQELYEINQLMAQDIAEQIVRRLQSLSW
ncbi:hypothetical protein THMIRHAS_20890 [Thiosulfatimonas sediminis]|uniref:LPS-assembly lipoprotein LptE n=1 Tax=Thiosulfatimonas sediminis TaxID=2675054 RepID=A0A6F8PX95_9GAMM|nr:hypothetical protein [Thiosulfatimonas sediminis]BBP46716.1 hypothetical protein THMIRHAS_20890 [Thiosulfatimonas sediminis]